MTRNTSSVFPGSDYDVFLFVKMVTMSDQVIIVINACCDKNIRTVVIIERMGRKSDTVLVAVS